MTTTGNNMTFQTAFCKTLGCEKIATFKKGRKLILGATRK